MPGGGPLRADRAHAELRLEPHLGEQRQPRPVPREALRAGRVAPTRDSRHYVYKGQCRADADASTPARSTACTEDLPGHRPRPGLGHGHGRRQAVRDRPPALDLRRGRRSARRPARHDRRAAARPSRASGTPPTSSASRSTGRYANRDTTAYFSSGKLPTGAHPAPTSCCRRSAPATTTGAGSSPQHEHPHDVDPTGRPDPQLEQQARARAGRPVTTTAPTARSTASRCSTTSRAARGSPTSCAS